MTVFHVPLETCQTDGAFTGRSRANHGDQIGDPGRILLQIIFIASQTFRQVWSTAAVRFWIAC
jgi:hypothetical protein